MRSFMKNMSLAAAVLALSLSVGISASAASPAEKGVPLTSAYFPDKNFCKELKRFDSNSDGRLSDAEIGAVKRLDIKDKEISSLDGIEYLTSLSSLNCSGNSIKKLSLSKNSELFYLDCADNGMTSLGVSKNKELVYLYCGGNKLKKLDVTHNADLKELVCSKNSLSVLDVSKNVHLQKLDCYHNELTSLDVTKNKVLKSLGCDHNMLTKLDVTKNEELVFLRCDSNRLTSLDLSRNTELNELDCGDNMLTSLDLRNNTKITEYDKFNYYSGKSGKIKPVFSRKIKLDSKGRYDLSKLPGFDPSKVYDIKGGSIKDGILTVDNGAESVTYRYNDDNGNTKDQTFTLTF